MLECVFFIVLVLMMAISKLQRQTLKAQAHGLKPVVLLGSKGLTDAVLQEIDVALRAHELIKVKLTGQDRNERGELATTISETLHAEFIQMIGLMLILYRKNPDK
jgi:RNA-binding protein